MILRRSLEEIVLYIQIGYIFRVYPLGIYSRAILIEHTLWAILLEEAQNQSKPSIGLLDNSCEGIKSNYNTNLSDVS